MYASRRGNNEARANVEHSMETINKYKETILELEFHIENRRLRVNLLRQELRDEKHTSFIHTHKIESYELEKKNLLMMLVLLTLLLVKHLP